MLSVPPVRQHPIGDQMPIHEGHARGITRYVCRHETPCSMCKEPIHKGESISTTFNYQSHKKCEAGLREMLLTKVQERANRPAPAV
jgi:hypothetical protein